MSALRALVVGAAMLGTGCSGDPGRDDSTPEPARTDTGMNTDTTRRASDTATPPASTPSDTGTLDTGEASDTASCDDNGREGRIGGIGQSHELADAVILGEYESGFFGEVAASSSGPLTADRRRAMVVGSPMPFAGQEPFGAAYVIPWDPGARLDGRYQVADVAYATLVGDKKAPNETLGEGVVVAELTGDGQEDVIVNDGLGGVIFLVPGPIAPGRRPIDEVTTVHIFGRPAYGQSYPNNRIGHRMFPRDVDGDGQLDLLLAEPEATAVYLLDGPLEGEIDYNDDARTTFGKEAGGWLGYGTDAGDIDGDGLLDVGIGGGIGPERFYAPTGVMLVRGPVPSGHIELLYAEVQLVGPDKSIAGTAVEANGDFDGDGTNDLVVGGDGYWPYHDGGVWLVSYPPDGETELDAVSFARIDGDYAGGFGHGVEVAGDLDGDGCDDLVVQGYYANSYYYGPLSGTHWQTEAHRHTIYAAGESAVAPLGDVDEDGFDDLATGDLVFVGDAYTYNSGAMHIYYGGLAP